MSSIATICIYLVSAVLASTREEELSQIGPHESVTFETSHFVSDHQLEFDLFGEHYKIQLIPNHDHIGSLIKTSGTGVSSPQVTSTDHESTQLFHTLTETCHYFGRVLEPPQPGNHSYLSLSLCPNSGIRGFITVPSKKEKLVIYPAQFVMDSHYDRTVGRYDLNDPHLIYKQSIELHPYPTDTVTDTTSHSSRHLLGYNTQNIVELYVLVDAAWTKWFKDDYGSRWYSELLQYTTDIINGASAEFEWWNFGQAGKIKVKMVELELMGDWTAQYTAMKPTFNSPASFCQDGSSWVTKTSKGCKIDGLKYMYAFKKYQNSNRKYGDTHLMLSGLDFQKAGWGITSTMCKPSSSLAVDGKGGIKNDYTARMKTTAHEIGHTFGMPHYSGIGVMGQPKWKQSGNSYVKDKYGDYDVLKSGWSAQSVAALNAYFVKEGGLSCLQSGVRAFKKVDNSGGGSSGGGNSGGSSSGGGSVCISQLSSRWNGDWTQAGTKNGKKAYNKGSNWLFYVNGAWTLSGSGKYGSNVANPNEYCARGDVTDCSGTWKSFGSTVYGSRFSSCGAFTAEEKLECLESNEYKKGICVTISDELTFVLSTDECWNDKAVYKYRDEPNDVIFTLFYNEYYEYIDSVAKSGEWAIASHDAVTPDDVVASCDETDLLQCVEGKWEARWDGNDTLEMIVNPTMSVTNGYCASYIVSVTQKDNENKSDAHAIVVWIGIALLAIVLVVCGVFIYRSRLAKKGAVAIGDHDESDADEEDMEVEVAVETESNQTTQ